MHRVPKPLFGGTRAWQQSDFTASDDRVRGGSSQSYLTPSVTLTSARFHGTLDTTTLGGAGFASQRTTAVSTVWDLSDYHGVELKIARGDGKKYTLNIKTMIPEKMPNGRDASTIEYAYNFVAPETRTTLFARWDEFRPYYRGKPVGDAEPLDTSQIRRWSLMMRSFFEEQSGPFSVVIRSIKARQIPSPEKMSVSEDESKGDDSDWDRCDTVEKDGHHTEEHGSREGVFRLCAIL